MTKEDIKYIEDYLEWVRQNMNPAEVDFEHFSNGMMNCNNILSQALSLHNVVGQSEQLSCNTCKFYPVDYDSFCATCKNFEKHVKAT
ncbi:MAG: hypothetical protein HRU26_05775 [Psychroserpens sp.]|nr:hypothetical protein [Psychroserpens sp.]